MTNKQVYNPFLPLNEYIPDGEPHIFGDRVYHYGSHDMEGGYTFCMKDYVTYSAPVDDLTAWRYEGVIFKASQDPDYPEKKYMYAPDVVQGNDGKYYLYYCMSGDYGQGGYTGTIHVAVSDSPAGKFEYIGEVHYADGTPMHKYVCFDPAAINDNGTIRIYYGTQYNFEEQEDFNENPQYIKDEMEMFGRTKEELMEYINSPESYPGSEDPDSIMGAVMVVVEDDMLTVKEEPRHIIPYRVKGTSFEEHPFFEASSMRKVGEKYYFVYSSFQNHELCYATSDYPDRDFTFCGTIVSNGDIGYNGLEEKDKHNMTGTTHGSIIDINGQWYVFYHRLTHKSDYSRQACAEKIEIKADGSIEQVEITSCGLNYGPLKADAGDYPAVIACIITNGHMPHGCNSIYQVPFPNVTHSKDERFIAEIEDGTKIGFKYFDCQNVKGIEVTTRTETENNKVVYEGPLRTDSRSNSAEPETISVDNIDKNDKMVFELRLEENGESICEIELADSEQWCTNLVNAEIPDGVNGLFFVYRGKQRIQFKSFKFIH